MIHQGWFLMTMVVYRQRVLALMRVRYRRDPDAMIVLIVVRFVFWEEVMVLLVLIVSVCVAGLSVR